MLRSPQYMAMTDHGNKLYYTISKSRTLQCSPVALDDSILFMMQLPRDYIHIHIFSTLSLSRTTGAAGMLNHHSLHLLAHLSVLALLGGECLVNISRNITKSISLAGKMATVNAIKTSVSTAVLAACSP